jgi:hypothetical protein
VSRVLLLDGPCPACCSWAIVFGPQPQQMRTDAGEVFYVPLTFEQWLVWHMHVISHQRLDRATPAPELLS